MENGLWTLEGKLFIAEFLVPSVFIKKDSRMSPISLETSIWPKFLTNCTHCSESSCLTLLDFESNGKSHFSKQNSSYYLRYTSLYNFLMLFSRGTSSFSSTYGSLLQTLLGDTFGDTTYSMPSTSGNSSFCSGKISHPEISSFSKLISYFRSATNIT